MDSGEGFESCARGMFGVRRRGVSSVDARVVAAQASNLYHVARSTYESSRGSMPPTSFVNASTGLRLRICTWKGTGNGEPTVLLFHGACDDARVWDGMCKRLCATGMVDCCIGPDMRGHGGSARSSDPTCNADVLLQDALSIAIERDLYRAPLALVGVGEGACVAIKMAALYPRLVGSVVCIDYAANVDPPERHPLQGKTWKQPAEAFLELLQNAHGIKPESIAQLLDIRVVDDDIHGGCRCRMDPGWCYKSNKEERKRDLAALACPLLLIRGEKSSVIREEDLKYTQELASQSPFCKIHTVHGYNGHLPVDCPGKLSRTLERWLRKTEEYYMVKDPESRRPELLNIRPLPQYSTIEEAAKALRPRAIPTPSMIAEELAKLRAEDEQSSDSDSDEDHLTSLAKEPAEYFGFVG